MRRDGRRATLAIIVSGVLTLWAASPAQAAVTAQSGLNGTFVSISSDGAGDTITMGCVGGQVRVNNVAVTVPSTVSCTDLSIISVQGGGGTDTVSLGSVSTSVFPALTATTIATQEPSPSEADTVIGTQVRDLVNADFKDTVTAGGGDDLVLNAKDVDAGDGDDTVVFIGNSVLGGAGDDRIEDPVAGPVDGGVGNDTISYDLSHLDLADVTNVSVTDTDGTFDLGVNGIQTTVVTSVERWELSLPDGRTLPQRVDSRSYSGRTLVRGNSGPDTVLSGPGSDFVDGGTGADVIDPGAGSDTVWGGRDGDTISVRDGAADIVDCGDGSDTVVADRSDALSNCENVSLPAPETGKIAGPKKVAKGAKGTFTFGSSVAGATFECRVDKGAFKACSSPFKLKTKKLKTGKHTLTVRAVQPAGNADPTPSTLKFKVIAPKH